MTENNNRPRRHYNNRPRRIEEPTKTYSKGMILVKSSVFILFIVLTTLIVALFIAKNKKQTKVFECKASSVKIDGKIEQIIVNESEIFVLSAKGELVKLGRKCLNEKARVKFN
jgi:hypothetical protein